MLVLTLRAALVRKAHMKTQAKCELEKVKCSHICTCSACYWGSVKTSEVNYIIEVD